jgi:heterodisulfide reductase subunit B
MKYTFYPGCSMHAMAIEYQSSLLAVMRVMGAEVEELEDWTCCGASVASVLSDLLGLALPARNLALAERAGADTEMLIGCSACYTNFQHTIEETSDSKTLEKVNQALEVEGLTYQRRVQTRHLMDVLANDYEPEEIKAHVKRPLKGLKVAPYYGCQTVRPYSSYDDDNYPTSMVGVLEALGATVHHHLREATCCGTALLTTKPEIGFGIAGEILDAASPADCIAVVCPMCHMNLDSYQDKVSKVLGKPVDIPVLFLPQLMGLAFGLADEELKLKRHVVPVEPVLNQLAAA